MAGSGMDERAPPGAYDPLCGVGERRGRAGEVGELADPDGNPHGDPEKEPDPAFAWPDSRQACLLSSKLRGTIVSARE